MQLNGHMPDVPAIAPRRRSETKPYRERLTPGPSLFIACALLIPAGLLVFLPLNFVVGIIAAIALYGGAVAFLLLTTPVIEVTETGLRAGRAILPGEFVGEAVALHGEDAFMARGRELDARAFTLLRGFVKDVVRVENTDQQDPAPYWVISSRHADQLARALNAQ